MLGTEEDDILSQEDAILLLYVAGELDEADRRALDLRVESDAGLRGRLSMMTTLDNVMRAEVDARPVANVDSRRALSQSLRLVREQALVLQSRPMLRPAGRRLAGVPRWMWGTAVAASVAVGMLVWISNSDPTPPRSPNRNADEASRIIPSEVRAFSAAYLPIEAEGTQSEPGDINAEVDALNMLAMMNEPADNDADDK